MIRSTRSTNVSISLNLDVFNATEITTCFGSFHWLDVLCLFHVSVIVCLCGQRVYLTAKNLSKPKTYFMYHQL